MKGNGAIQHFQFMNNQYNKTEKVITNNFFADGIHIQFSRNELQAKTSLIVSHCSFKNNKQWRRVQLNPNHGSYFKSPDLSMLYGYRLGGGMSLLFMRTCQGVDVILDDCDFLDNKAYLGAGLYAHFQDHATKNSLIKVRGQFWRNWS